MAITKRCIRCRKKVRDDGTCQNPNCVLYVPPKEEPVEEVEQPTEPVQEETPVEQPTQETTAEEQPKQEEPANDTNVGDK